MLKNKIAHKLSLYFGISLLAFALIIGGIFMLLFRKNTMDLHKTELVKRASSIANTLSNYMDSRPVGMMGGYGMYLRFIGDIAGTDVWIIDSGFNLVTSGMNHGMMGGGYVYSDLPPGADTLIKEVFTGETVFSEDFSGILSELTLTIGVPIQNDNGNILGVVLLHSPVNGINEAVWQGFIMLGFSMLAALAVVLAISVGFSVTFTKPLNRMKDVALWLADGDYTVKTGIRQNDEVGKLAETLDILAERLDEASRQSAGLEQMRRDFVANISHELRTPVTVIRGSLQALTEKVVTDPVQVEEYHNQMLTEAIYLQRLIGDLLDLSRLQNPDFVIEKADFSICECLDDAIRSASQIAASKDVVVSCVKGNGSCGMAGDYGRIRQMLLIILDNAIKFSPCGGTVEVVWDNNILTIRDYGIGIPKEDLPYIFDRFYKSRSEQNKTGTGLGLAIAKQIADRHGIGLSAEAASSGAMFSFEFKMPQN